MNGRLQSIDILRGIAILAVLAIHAPHDAPGGIRENIWFIPSMLAEYGYLGVHLFVLISGFCIHRRAAIEKAESGQWQLNWIKFWKRRFWRLYPPYLAAIVVSLIAAIWFHDRFAIDRNTIGWDLLFHGFMLHNLTADFATSLGNGAFWSLGMEEQLYAGYFLLLVMIRKRSAAFMLAVVGTVTIIWRVTTAGANWIDVGPFELGKWYLWPTMFWLHWALGAVAVDAAHKNVELPAWTRSIIWALILCAISLVLNKVFVQLLNDSGRETLVSSLLSESWQKPAFALGELFAAVSFFVLMNWLLSKEGRWIVTNPLSVVIAWLGRLSYSLYLIHIPVFSILEPYNGFDPYGIGWPLRMLFFWIPAILCSVVFFHLVERWFLSGKMPKLPTRTRSADAT